MANGTITRRGKRPLVVMSNPVLDADDAREARRAARLARQEEQPEVSTNAIAGQDINAQFVQRGLIPVPKTADGSRSDTDGRHTSA